MADFKQAVQWMKQGKRIKREIWNDMSRYVYWECEKGVAGKFVFSYGEIDLWQLEMFLATDWEIYKQEKVLMIVQEINGVQRYETRIKKMEELACVFRRKTLLVNMNNLDEMTIKLKWEEE